MRDPIEIVDRSPTLHEYLKLADAVGWSAYVSPDTARRALAGSLFATVAETRDCCLGMARIVGDGALFFYIQDVAVAPDFQRQGVGHLLMERLMRWLSENAPDRAFVGLFSASGKASFYNRYGFTAAGAERPGMSQYLRMPK
jgi:GNAT superfamily N-acetyltransferase